MRQIYRTDDRTLTAGNIPQQTAILPGDALAGSRRRLVEEFLSCQDVRESSRKTYRQSLDQFFSWIDAEHRSLGTLTVRDIIDFKNALISSGHKTLTVRSYLAAVRKFYRWADSRSLYGNIASAVKPPKVNQGGAKDHFIKMHLTEEQAISLLDTYQGQPRNYAMVNLMLRTGLRTIEVSRARIEDIRYRGGQRILQVWGKGMDAPDPSVFVVLTEASYGPIKDYLATRPGALSGEPLFTTQGLGSNIRKDKDGRTRVRLHSGEAMSTRLIQMIVKEGLRAIGLDDHAYSAHSLRHTTATQMLRRGATILDVQRTLRHESVETSMIYISSIQEEEHLRNAPEAILDGSFRKNTNL